MQREVGHATSSERRQNLVTALPGTVLYSILIMLTPSKSADLCCMTIPTEGRKGRRGRAPCHGTFSRQPLDLAQVLSCPTAYMSAGHC